MTKCKKKYMSLFIETIQVFQGNLLNLAYHQERFERTRVEALGLKHHPRLSEVILVPKGLEHGVFKCRVSYHKEISLVEYERYQARAVRSLKMVYSDSIDYGFKYSDRGELNKLFSQRQECDDIVVVKNGYVSDSFVANVVFWDGAFWVTPDTPLLAGTMRASLLARDLIRESKITPEDIDKFRKLKLINAMNDLQNAPDIPIESIL